DPLTDTTLEERRMKPVVALYVLICLVGGASTAAIAQERGSGASPGADPAKLPARSDGVPLEQLIAAVAKKTGKKFIVDNRVSGNAGIWGQEVSAINYGDLLSILLLNGYTAIEGSTYVSVIP